MGNDFLHTVVCPYQSEAQQGTQNKASSPASELLDLLELLAAGSVYRHADRGTKAKIGAW